MALDIFKSFSVKKENKEEQIPSKLDLEGREQERVTISLGIELETPCVFVKSQCSPETGSHIRVKRKNGVYDHGIYVSDTEVYYVTGRFYAENFENSKPECTSLDEFLCGDTLEVRAYTEDQASQKQQTEIIVSNARDLCQNFKAYNLMWKGRDNFSNLCTFSPILTDFIRDINIVKKDIIVKDSQNEDVECKKIEINSKWTNPSEFVKGINPQRGDHIRVQRLGSTYQHHGIFVSETEVYHKTGEYDPREWKNAKPDCTTLEEFLDGGEVEVRIYPDEEQKSLKCDVDTIVANAKRMYYLPNNNGYNLFTDNCECFANSCLFVNDLIKPINGVGMNKQAQKAKKIGQIVLAVGSIILVGGRIVSSLAGKDTEDSSEV